MSYEDLVQIRLPTAKPELYLRWVEFTTAVIEKLREFPQFQEAEANFPSSLAGRDVFENQVVPAARAEAEAAERERRVATPVVEIPRHVARSMMEAILIRAEWLGLYEGANRMEALGIAQPDEEMMDLYLRAIAAIREVAFEA